MGERGPPARGAPTATSMTKLPLATTSDDTTGVMAMSTDRDHRFYDQGKIGPLIQQAERDVAARAAEQEKEEAARREEIRRLREAGEAKEDARRAAVRAAIEERMAAERAAAVAAVRANVETDLRRNGVPEAEIAKRADVVMGRYHEDQAFEAATLGDRQRRQAEDYFRSRPAPTFHERDDQG